MKKLLIATVAVLGFAGVAAAQQAPQLVGNYSANVLEAYNANQLDQTRVSSTGTDFNSRASAVDSAYSTDHGGIVSAQTSDDIRSGR
jgi:hypothetical protein